MLPIDSVGIAMAGSLPRRSREAIDQTIDSGGIDAQATGGPPAGEQVSDMLSENADSPSAPAHAC